MEDAFKKISNYSNDVEHDLESLIFVLLNLIDTKTKTLKKLLKLHLQVRSIRKTANSKYMEHYKSHGVATNDIFPMLFKDSVDDLSFSENCQNADEISELKGISVSFGVSQSSSVDEIVQTEVKVDANPKDNNNGVTSDDENMQHENLNSRDLSEKTYDISQRKVLSALQIPLRECSTSTNWTETEDIQRNGSTKSTQFELLDSESVKTVISPQYNVNVDNLENDQIVNSENHSSTSSTNSYCVVSHLQGVLNTLQDCLPGDSGFYIENSSYRDLVNILERLVISCGVLRQEEPNRPKVFLMNKCSTQPTLKTTYEEVPKRLIFSSTECNKVCKKKLRM